MENVPTTLTGDISQQHMTFTLTIFVTSWTSEIGRKYISHIEYAFNLNDWESAPHYTYWELTRKHIVIVRKIFR